MKGDFIMASIYTSKLNITSEATITLTADERKMICEALGKCAPKEVDIIPIMTLMDKIVKGR